MNWISTKEQLPQSRKFVLAAVINEYNRSQVLRAMYARSKTLPLALDAEVDFSEYDEDTDEYYCPEGWYEMNEYEETHWAIFGQITHWCELPELPSEHIRLQEKKNEEAKFSPT